MYSGVFHAYGDLNGPHYYDLGQQVITRPIDKASLVGLADTSFFRTSKITRIPLLQILNELMRVGDGGYGTNLGEIKGLKFDTIIRPDDHEITAQLRSGQALQILDSNLFGIEKSKSKTPSLLTEAADNKIAELLTHNIEDLRTSIASTAMAMYRGGFVDTVLENPKTGEEEFFPDFGSLNSRWREMAKAAVHGGPIACLRGGSDDAVEVDIRGAYLHALAGEMPVCCRRYEDPLTGEMKDPSYFAGGPNFTWNDIIRNNLEHGFVDATVYVRDDIKYGLPPLPITHQDGMIFPRGRFRGVWTLPLVRMAVEMGEAVVEEVHHSFFPRMTQNTFAPFADELKRLPKHISKELYTKFWGKFNQSGGFNFTKIFESHIKYGENFEVLECPDFYAPMLVCKSDGKWYIDYRLGDDVVNNNHTMVQRVSEDESRGISGNYNHSPYEQIGKQRHEKFERMYKERTKPFPRLIRTDPNSEYFQVCQSMLETFIENNQDVRNHLFKGGALWYSTEIEQLDEATFRKFRPDLAAYISSYNIMNVYKGMRQLDPKSIIATHVDAIWTDDIEGAQRLCDNSSKVQWLDPDENQMFSASDYGGWNIKRRGDLQFLACGVYIHKGPKLKLNGKKAFKTRTRQNDDGEEYTERVYENLKIGCSGYDSSVFGTVNEKSLKTWIRKTKNRQSTENIHTRLWEDSSGKIVQNNPKIRPEFNKNAISQSFRVNQIETVRPFGGIDFFSPDWTRNGDHSTQVARWREAARRRREANRTNNQGEES